MDGWPEVGDWRWMTGDGSQETYHGRRMTINVFSDMKLRSCNRAQNCRHTVFRWDGSTECDTEHSSEMANYVAIWPSSNAEYDPESDPVSQLQCRYRTSSTRSIFGGAMIINERDDSAGCVTTLIANNYCTGSAGTKQRETHSPIEKASNGEKCTQRSDGKRTYRWIKKMHAHVAIPNEIPTQSWQSRINLDNPQIHICYLKSTSESSLINRYGTQRCRDELVICRATTYNRGMTVLESKTTPTTSIHRTGSAGRKHIGAHLPAENRRWTLVNKCTGRMVNQCNWRCNDKWIQKTMIWIPRQVTASTPGQGAESIPGGKLTSVPGNWRW